MDINKWKEMSRLEQLEWYEKHTYIPIPPPNEGYKVTLTERYVLWMMCLGYICKYRNKEYAHYEEVNNLVREIFNKPNFLLSSYATLAREPFRLIDPEKNETKKTNRSGYFKLSKKVIQFITGKIRVPKSVLFYDYEYSILEGEYIYINEVPKLNFKQAFHILKTY
jgi:hypothetical protein